MTDIYVEERLKKLESHLAEENDVLSDIVQIFRELDHVGYELGLLNETESYANHVSWWPMISILGTFSAGKSSFINAYLGQTLQRTGNHAVDDKFTVLCFSGENASTTLPGIALDADPRFPFYQISKEIQDVLAQDGRRIDAYLQLKTCPSEKVRGKILIDSPGFDADGQRTSTLKITKHIINLSDLVLVFFDARHPEPGAMQDTLRHLVTDTINRPDSNKFLYVLNQIDVTAREDNPEEVVAAWQRALAQSGLTAGRFYRIYNPEAAIPIENPTVKQRFESKRDEDMAEINNRMEQVGIERTYRIISMLEQTAKDIENTLIPQLRHWIKHWRSTTLRIDFWVMAILAILITIAYATTQPDLSLLQGLSTWIWTGIFSTGFILFLLFHLKVSRWIASRTLKKIETSLPDDRIREALLKGFNKNICHFRLTNEPYHWSMGLQKKLAKVLGATNSYVQKLNDRFTNPSGRTKT
ncbi:dynamin family protein [Beggiatoa leptomitoformis]|uniref:Dynamin family protein n=1 Tax=Beggiatoa leptomitoformis TaxID=288004 RepID=A0A2N9YF75_9GAMM|nr:dynamin family protein [Beggiatoa leptomitoformis]ALG68642.1 dynamin family protein [Beggiatoa leptomitoformis]AUI69009.1 dynamin family protein [Beggiatoa leptomitoformis]